MWRGPWARTASMGEVGNPSAPVGCPSPPLRVGARGPVLRPPDPSCPLFLSDLAAGGNPSRGCAAPGARLPPPWGTPQETKKPNL